MDAPVSVVTFASAKDTCPRPVQATWPQLAAKLTKHDLRPTKEGMAFSPAVYREGQTRGNGGVQALTCFVADIDDGTPPDDLRRLWHTPDGEVLAFVLYSTHSSTVHHARWRVVFPLAVPVPAAEWPAVWRKLNAALTDGRCDPATKDAARLSFFPACPEDRQADAFSEMREGAWLNPADFADPPQEELADRMAATMQRRERLTLTADGSGAGKPGEDFNSRASVADVVAILEAGGWQECGRQGHAVYVRRPGKAHDVSGVVGFRNDPTPIFYCFTSSAPPLEARSYAPFSVLGLLQHGGDFTEAAKALGKQGYGEQKSQIPCAISAVSAVSTPGEGDTALTALMAQPPEQSEWPVLKPEALHDLAGKLVAAIDPHTESDPVAILVQILAAFGNVIDRTAYFQAEADKHFGNMFVVLVGVSSKGRKGTSWGHVRRQFAGADPLWESGRVVSGLSSGEGLIYAVRDPIEKQEKNKKTGEMETVLVDAGVEDKRIFVIESEFASVLKQTQREGNTLSPVVRNGWDTGNLQSLTKNSPAKATGAHCSIIGHITSTELKKDLAETETANGFGNRFLWLCVKRSKELPFGGDIESVNFSGLLYQLQGAITHARAQGRLSMDKGARAMWASVYHDLSSGKPGLLGALTGRSEAQTMRLALLYALLDGDTLIRAAHLTAALALWDYCEASVRYIFGASTGSKLADDILKALHEKPDGMTRDDLRELFQRHQSSSQIGQALGLLAECGRARVEKQATQGRPAERWFST